MAAEPRVGTPRPCFPTASALDVVLLAASAGGPDALRVVLHALPRGFRLPVVIVQHRSARGPALLSRVLSFVSALPIREAMGGEVLLPSTAYLAPPDRHLLFSPDRTLVLSEDARVHNVRPAADLLFASAARVFRGGVVAVVLTGSGVDGAAGVQAVKEAGGLAIAQDESTSAFFSMPNAAIRTGLVDLVLPLQQIGSALARLAQTGAYP